MKNFCIPGRASVLLGGQWGSEAKGCAAAWVARELSMEDRAFDIVTTNAGAQAGHTSIHLGNKRVVYHLPTAPFIAEDNLGKGKGGIMYINAGSIIDPVSFEKELNDNPYNGGILIHPMAAVITDECREAEMKADSSRTKIASTRKGVGEAQARKVVRSGQIAKDHPFLKQFVGKMDLNDELRRGAAILVEVPQGVSLSLNHSGFYPYTTCRDCTIGSGLSDAGIHPRGFGKSMVVLRTFPIRVGNIVEDGKTIGESGDCYHDQFETSWEKLGVQAEITTVTKRVRRVFTFSYQQIVDTFSLCMPDYVFLTFCNYVQNPVDLARIAQYIRSAADVTLSPHPQIFYQWGPTTDDVTANINNRKVA